METRTLIAYALIALMLAVAAFLISRVRGRRREHRRTGSSYYRARRPRQRS